MKKISAGKKKIQMEKLQKLGEILMAVIAVMPVAGLMISLGKAFQMFGLEEKLLAQIGSIMENVGWAIINNLHLLFAAAIGGQGAKKRAGGAFAAIIAFILIHGITGHVFGVTNEMLGDGTAMVYSFWGKELSVGNYFTSVLGAPALNMGVFGGIISGFLGAKAYNKYHDFRRLPKVLSFFGGESFVPLAVVVWSGAAAFALAWIWPLVQTGINRFGIWIAESAETAPVMAPFIYGTVERMLIPLGLHHMLVIPMNYTAFGGTYIIQTGVNAGVEVFGQDPLWLAWVTDLIYFKDAGNIEAYQHLLTHVTPARFKAGQMIGATGLLPGITLAMYKRVESGKKEKYRSAFLSTVLAAVLTGVTEPLEFMFMFCAMPLYIVYALLQGCAFALAGIIPLRQHAFGNIEYLLRLPMSIKAGLWGDVINYVAATVLFFGIGFAVAYILIDKWKLATPGRMEKHKME